MKRTSSLIVGLVLLASLAAAGPSLSGQTEPTEPEGRHCSDATISGTYGFIITGTVAPKGVGVPYATVGHFTSNGKGKIAGAATTGEDGQFAIDIPFTGTISISANCTGTITVTDPGGIVTNYHLVVVDEAKELLLIQTDVGSVVSGRATKR